MERGQERIRGVLERFYAMCAYPHGSWNEGKLADYMEGELKSRGWAVSRDAVGNLRADIPASPGKERVPLAVVQGHLDMVCAHGDGWDPMTDTVNAFVEEGVLRTDGRSSLGADNNLGNAAALYLLDHEFAHGPIRLLLTVAEEVGLQGASAMDPNWLEGARYLINTDGFKLGRAVISSAGGTREEFFREIRRQPAGLTHGWRLEISGGMGGHSGDDINRGRANAICLLVQFLEELGAFELAELTGGHALNAIPLNAHALIRTDEERVEELAERFNGKLRTVYGTADPGVRLTAERTEVPSDVLTAEDRDGVLNLIGLLHNGVFAMHDTIPNLVAASSNTGVVTTEESSVKVVNYTRSAWGFARELMESRHDRAARVTGFSHRSGGYPSWNGDRKAPMVQAMAEIYRTLTGEEMEITGVHVGLEPAVLGAMNPDMEMVVTGPEIIDPHSVNERAPVDGLPIYVELLRRTLEWIAEQ